MSQGHVEETSAVVEKSPVVAEALEEIHPLLQVETEFVTSWSEWKELWKSKLPAIVRHGLLHYGFQVRTGIPGEYTERLLFYLQAADGHCDIWSFKTIGERQIEMCTPFNTTKRMTPQDVNRVLSEKAFVELARNLFKNMGRRGEIPSWYSDIFRVPGVFEKVLWFFRPAENESWLRNLGRHWDEAGVHYQEASDFLLDLCRMGWNFNYLRDNDEEARQMLVEARPRLVEVLSGLNRLDFLLRVYRIEEKIDETCLTKLEELALGKNHELPSGKYKSLEDALCGGDPQAAQVLMVLRLKIARAARIEQIRDLEHQRQAAQAQLEKLTATS